MPCASMCRAKSARSRPYALSECPDSSTSHIQGTSALDELALVGAKHQRLGEAVVDVGMLQPLDALRLVGAKLHQVPDRLDDRLPEAFVAEAGVFAVDHHLRAKRQVVAHKRP